MKRSIIGSTVRAVGRFTRGVVAVGTVGVSELAIAGGKKVCSIFKRKDEDYEDDFDFEDFEDEVEDITEAMMSYCEVEQPTAKQMEEAAKSWEEPAKETQPQPQTAGNNPQ